VENDNTQTEKPVKVPGVFKRPIKERKFEKRFVKYIEHPGDRQFFTGCFEKQQETYVIRGNLTKDDIKKLKNIVKWIKKNRKGAIKFAPLAFAGIFIAAIVLFFTVFANPLLGRATELGLEAIFEAKADVRSFRLRLIPLSISIGSITVANRDAPMTNLFEMGRTAITLKTTAVLRGKIYIEEVRADAIQFGTARKTSGALPAKPAKVKEEKQKSEGPPLIDFANFDAMALLNQEFDKLSSPKIYDAAINAYNETYEKWRGQVDVAKAKAEELKTATQPLLNINVNNMRDIETITKTVQDINTMVNTVQSAADEATGMVRGIETDVNNARALEQNARNAITNDINHLKSYIDIGGGAAFAALEPFIRDILSDSAEVYLDYGLRALEVLELLKAQAAAQPKTEKAEKPKKEKKIAFKGRDVIYPSVSYPKFYLGTLASDVTQGSWKGAFNLGNVSSDPDLTWRQTNKPISLTIDVNEISGSLRREINFAGNADFRSNLTNDDKRFDTKVSASGFPVNLGNQLNKVGINGFSGLAAMSINMSGHIDGGVSAGGDVSIKQARLNDPKGMIAEAAATAVSKAGQVDLGIQYIHNIGQRDEFKINTNIASLIADALKGTAQAYAQKAMADLEKALRQKIDEYIDGKFASKEQVDLLLRTARGDMAAIEQVKSSLNSKVNELEKKIKDEAARQAEQAAKDLLQGQTPSLQVPSLPRNPFGR